MRALIIDKAAREALQKLVVHAEANVFTMDDLLDLHNGQGPMAGDLDGYSCVLPVGFRVVFSIEDQVPGKVWHLSMSVDKDDRLPNPHAVEVVMKELGFKNELHECSFDLAYIGPNRKAINVWEIHEYAEH
jgi:hypothetical protein